MRKRRLILNTVFALAYEITAIICGFILPRLILKWYGSEVNGLVSSITQFMSVVNFLQMGLGAVIQSALYKPLAEKDTNQISRVIVSATKFFHKLAAIFLVYVAVLAVAYPHFTATVFDAGYIATLIVAMSISSFAQYYFGLANGLLLTADQRAYLDYSAQILTLIVNNIFSVILILNGASIQTVKIITSLIYVVRPLFLYCYVNRHYKLDRKIQYESEPITQKWNGVAQHFAAIVLDNTDTIILTLFSTLTNVSIYSVYHLVVYGIKKLFTSLTHGIHPIFGELWAKHESERLRQAFSWTEWVIHTGAIFVFGCTSTLLIPFISVYTSDIHDANYLQPLFGYLIVLAHAFHCLRIPYNIMILAAGHYKQTQHSYIIAAVLNIVVSMIAVSWFGLIGVAIGTVVAMVYQTVWMAYYDSKNLIKWPFGNFFKQVAVDAISVVLGVFLTQFCRWNGTNYLAWVMMAIKVSLLWGITVIIVNGIFYHKRIRQFRKMFGHVFLRRG